MRILVVYCHPHAESYCHALLERVVAGLAVAEHAVDVLDLYREGFDPVLREAEWIDYMRDPGKTARTTLAEHVARLERAEGLCFVFPTWNFGLPAMLKGWFERVWLPGVAFDLPEDGGLARSRLRRVRLLAAVTTTAMPWLTLQWLGYPGQRLITRCVGAGVSRRAERIWMALHKIEASTNDQRVAFLGAVERRFARIR